MTKASEYGISVRLVIRDDEEMYEARVAELQDVIAFGETYADAYESAIEAVNGLQEMFAEKGKAFPLPEIEETEFSGRVTLRMSKSLHAAVHRRASVDCVSLNQWIVEAIACRIDGSVPLNSIYIASHARHDQSGNIGLRIQQAKYMISYAGTNFFAIQGMQEALPVISTHIPFIEMRANGQR